MIASAPRTRRNRPAAATAEHVLDVAGELFYWQGIRATGVDKIAASAGVAPTTLYRLFASKDDLVAAYVERSGVRYREWFEAAVEAAGRDPRDRILGLFEALSQQVTPAECRGCPFLMALAEVPDSSLPAHQHALATKAWVRERLGDLAADIAVTEEGASTDPAELADDLALLVEGVYGSAQGLGGVGPAVRARGIAERLLPSRG